MRYLAITLRSAYSKIGLSDSTIYPAFYCLSHLLHSAKDNKQPGLLNIKPEQMIDQVWDYVFCRQEMNDQLLEKSGIKKKDLETMRREFEYWYPLDMRYVFLDFALPHCYFKGTPSWYLSV